MELLGLYTSDKLWAYLDDRQRARLLRQLPRPHETVEGLEHLSEDQQVALLAGAAYRDPWRKR